MNEDIKELLSSWKDRCEDKKHDTSYRLAVSECAYELFCLTLNHK